MKEPTVALRGGTLDHAIGIGRLPRDVDGVMTLTIGTDGAGLQIKPQIRVASDSDMPPDYAPAPMGLLPGDTDEYIVTEGGLKGLRGFFTRDESGAVRSDAADRRVADRPGPTPGDT